MQNMQKFKLDFALHWLSFRLTTFYLRTRANKLAIVRISYGNSVCPSWCLSRPATDRRPGEIETLGFYHNSLVSSISWQNFMLLGEGDLLKRGGERKANASLTHRFIVGIILQHLYSGTTQLTRYAVPMFIHGSK